MVLNERLDKLNFNPLTRKRQKTGVCVKCTELANARKLALIRMPFYKLCWYMHG